jgi:hypothetical protein
MQDTSIVPTLSVANAKLPVVYDKARAALARLDRVDECKDWADKAEAMASYARQSKDESLFKMAHALVIFQKTGRIRK